MPKHTIDDLIALIPPPAARPATIDWGPTERRLGFRLPTDYKALADTYGPGVFCDDFLVWTGLPWPDAPVEEAGRRAVAELEPLLEDLSIVTWAHDDGTDTAVDLAGGSFFGWGRSTDGDSGYWHRTGDDPDGWPVLVTDGVMVCDYHRGGLVSYLYDFWTGGFSNRQVFAGREAPERLTFEQVAVGS